MDPLSTATIFATVVSLIADYKAHHSDTDAANFSEFAKWLAENRHDEILQLLNQNANTSISIKALLVRDKDWLAERFQVLDQNLAVLAGSIDGIADLAAALRPTSALSPQAASILDQFEDSGASKAVEIILLSGGPDYKFLGGKRGDLKYDDARFIEDDLAMLVDSGLLRQSDNHIGERLFLYTRTASQYVAERRSRGVGSGVANTGNRSVT